MSKKINIYNMDDARELCRENDHRVFLTGEVFLDHKRAGEFLAKDEYMGKNLLPTEGLSYLLNAAFTPSSGGTAKETAWYCSLFKGSSYTPAASNTAANTLSTGLCTEMISTDYKDVANSNSTTTRPAYTIVATATGVITNAAAKAEFLMTATADVYGALICSAQSRTATTGKLGAIKKFTTQRSVIDTDILYVTYQITAQST